MAELSSVRVIKGTGDRRLMLLIASNAYEDREQEIVREKALRRYVEKFAPTPLLYWHDGEPIGDIVYAEMVGKFLVEIALEPENHEVDIAGKDEGSFMVSTKELWDVIENNPDWGASIGFQFIKGDEQDGLYDLILKKETSVLPHADAANPYTLSQVFRRN